ncbi:hypothetical protein CROQUDRAFT_83438, partial [Cronartium quercuum f. sp. fusiforme G11]
MAMFWDLVSRTFNLVMMTVSEWTTLIDKGLNRLKSKGVVWTQDCLAGLLYQLGAPTSGEWSMEPVNIALDAQYNRDPKPFTA